MRVHELINVLNHFPPTAEIDLAPEIVTAEDGRKFSVAKTYDTLKDGSGHSQAVQIGEAENDGSGASA